MQYVPTLILFISISIVMGGSGCAKKDTEQSEVIGIIDKLHGKVIVDDNSRGKLIIGVDLTHTETTDADLEKIKGLTGIQSLKLGET